LTASILNSSVYRLPLILTSSVAINYGSKMSTKGWPVHSGVGLAVRKGDNELREALNSAFDELQRNGTYQKLLNKYFTVDLAVH